MPEPDPERRKYWDKWIFQFETDKLFSQMIGAMHPSLGQRLQARTFINNDKVRVEVRIDVPILFPLESIDICSKFIEGVAMQLWKCYNVFPNQTPVELAFIHEEHERPYYPGETKTRVDTYSSTVIRLVTAFERKESFEFPDVLLDLVKMDVNQG